MQGFRGAGVGGFNCWGARVFRGLGFGEEGGWEVGVRLGRGGVGGEGGGWRGEGWGRGGGRVGREGLGGEGGVGRGGVLGRGVGVEGGLGGRLGGEGEGLKWFLMKWRHTRSHSFRGCVTHFMGQVGWSGFAEGLRSAIARDAVLPTSFERQVSASHQVWPDSRQSDLRTGPWRPVLEVVLPDPILVVAPAIWWAPA